MTEAMVDQILAAAERVDLLGKTSRAQKAVVVAQALGFRLEDVQQVLETEGDTQ
jgi:hypothetical protein